MEPPDGTYVRIASCSGLDFKSNIHVIAGVIDPDYRGNITISLINQSNTPHIIKHVDKIAQFILEKVHSPNITIVDTLTQNKRGTRGFGSTEQTAPTKPVYQTRA